MTDSDLVAALRPVADALDALGVRYYLTGSVASSAHGIARASLDADVVAALEPDHVEPLTNRPEDTVWQSSSGSVSVARPRNASGGTSWAS
jgi:hypothetical protein